MNKIISLCVIAIIVVNVTSYHEKKPYEEDNTKHFPKNDFARLISDIWKKVGLHSIFQEIGSRLKIIIREGQSYSQKDFNTEWERLRREPGLRNLIYFLRQTTVPAIVKSCEAVINTVSNGQVYLLQFLKNKCDLYIGKNALLHPWNIMMEQDQQQVSMIVFGYFMALSLVLLKLLSWWNFMVYLAFCFLVYSFGGPYLVFKWLLTITAAFWVIFDVLLKYPLQIAIFIIVAFIYSYVRGFFSFSTVPITKLTQNGRHDVVSRNLQRDFRTLTSRLDGMERKTDILANKLEQLTTSMDKMLSDDEQD